MSFLSADLLLLLLLGLLLYGSARRVHYRDAPYLFVRRWLLGGGLSVVLHGAVFVGVSLMLIDLYSVTWWAAVVLSSFPMLLALRYALQVNRSPQRVAERNKRKWRGAERVP